VVAIREEADFEDMTIIDEVQWSHTLFEKDDDWIVTMLIRSGPIEVDVSVRLTGEEIALIKDDLANLKTLMADIRDNQENYADREINPPVWPD
jgi:hypothetical protein